MHTSRLDKTALLGGVVAALLAALVLAGALTSTAGAATSDRPSAGRFVGSHSFDGTITLRFKRESGIGLYVARYKLKGTLKCPDDEIALDFGGRVTARTAARVKSNGRFRLSLAGLRIDGRFFSSKRVRGDIEVVTLACTQAGGFSATRRAG